MKATDLMIGDWVNWEKGNMLTPCKIGIGDLMYVEEHAVAIPLTAEILKKNGFIQSDDEDMWLFDNFQMTIGFSQLIGGSRWITYKYVHELQHALHLCGLKEMANKFEI